MKFSSLVAFEKHLQDSFSSPSYLIATSDADERGMILSQVSSHLLKKYPDSQITVISQQDDPFAQLCATLSTIPLFSSHIILRIDDASIFSKKQIETLHSFIKKPSTFAFLLIGTSSLKEFSSLSSQAKEELVTLDLSQEKPWDKVKRLKSWIQKRCFDEGKKISLPLVDLIMDSCGADVLLLEQELVKLFTFVGERKDITEQDIRSVCVNYVMPTGWQMAEQLVFEGRVLSQDASFSLADFIPLLGQLRYHFVTGRQVAFYVARGAGKEEIASHMPQVRQMLLDKYIQLTKALPSTFFDEALRSLFKVELLSKNSSLAPQLLLDYLTAELSLKRNTYVQAR